MTFRAGIAMAVELIMAHLMAMETSGPISYVRVGERFIVLSQGQVQGVRGAWVIRDVEIGWEHSTFCPEVV